jgi:hypothetical protein
MITQCRWAQANSRFLTDASRRFGMTSRTIRALDARSNLKGKCSNNSGKSRRKRNNDFQALKRGFI